MYYERTCFAFFDYILYAHGQADPELNLDTMISHLVYENLKSTFFPFIYSVKLFTSHASTFSWNVNLFGTFTYSREKIQ